MNRKRKLAPDVILLNIGGKAVYFLFFVIMLYLLLLSLFTTCFMVYTDEHVYYLKDFALLLCGALAAFCILLALWKAGRERKWGASALSMQEREEREIGRLKMAAVLATAVLGLLMLWFVLYMKLPPVYDQSMVYYSAGYLIEGDYTNWEMGQYFSMLPYQNGMVLMLCPFAALFGENAYLAVQVFNIPVLFSGYAGIGKITQRLFDRKSGYYTYLALLFVVPMWTQVTFVYGTIPEISLAIWALYLAILFEETVKWRYIVGSGICILFSILWKSNAEIFLIAIILMLLVRALRSKNIKILAGAAIFLICGLTAVKGAPFLLQAITGEDMTRGIPMTAWLAMGLQESGIAPGWYNEFPMNLYRKISSDPEVIKGEVIKSFQASFQLFAKEKDYAVRFFARKTASMWADPAFQFFTTVNTRNLEGHFSYAMKDFFYNGGVMNTFVYLGLDVLQSIHYFGVVLFIILRRKKLKLDNAHLAVAFLGGFFFHLIGEAKSHYVMPYYLMTVPYMVQGYREMAGCLTGINWRDKQAVKALRKKQGLRFGALLTIVILLVSFLNIPAFTNTLKLGGQESDYIWFCQNETQWKEADYKKV